MAAKPNPIDDNKQGLIGKALDRVDGPLKVAGAATYAYEFLPAGKTAYGYIVGSAIPKGKIASIDASDAENAAGVLLVLTYKNSLKMAEKPSPDANPLEKPKPYLDSAEVNYYGDPVALVVAETFEEARNAAKLLKITYSKDEATLRLSVEKEKTKAYDPGKLNQGDKADSSLGNFDEAFNSAPVKIDSTYTTPYHHSQPMELHAAMAVWEGDKVTVYSAHQMPNKAQKSIADTFKISPKNIRIVAKYIGGGFGSKLDTQADAILAVMAAKKLGRPVKVAMTRQQVFFNATHRAYTNQRIRLGANSDGKLTAIAHDTISQATDLSKYTEQAGMQTRTLYAADNRLNTHRLVNLDITSAGSVRAPGEAAGMLAIEQAMDELAVKLNMDPVELRIKNEPEQDPEKKRPFSTRQLVKCLQEGAKQFGWDKRPLVPGSKRDGDFLVGYGVASAYRTNMMQKSAAKATLDKSGRLKIETSMTDIGTGTYTIHAQIAAETMGLPVDKVDVIMGDTDLPEAAGSGGSWGANSSGSGVYEACMKLREQLAKAAVKDKESPLCDEDADDVTFANGALQVNNKSESLTNLAARADDKTLIADGEIEKPKTYEKYSQASYGAHFAEVGVDAVTGEVRVRRMLGVFTAGRILNEKTANSQAIGGMIWGISAALHEGTVVDQRYGQFVNHDLAEYHVPVNADIAGKVKAVFLPEVDDKTGPLKIKGVGELGICGAGAAIANAVYNACGVRVRDYPITLDKIIKEMA